MIRTGGLIAFLGSLLVLGTAGAQEGACPYQPAIVSLADSVIEKRNELSGFTQRNFGTAAAYLKIRYEALADEQAESLLAGLIEGRARTITDLAFAWAYGRDGGAIGRLLGDDPVEEAVSVRSLSGMRAIVAAGDGDVLIGAIAALPDDSAVAVFHPLVAALVDLPDSIKGDLAATALEAGEPMLAAGLVAVHGKPEAWAGFTKALRDPALVEQATFMWRWAPALVGNPELPPIASSAAPANLAARQQIHEVLITAAMEPQADFLMTLLNQTGRVDEIAAAASAVRRAIDDGAVASDGVYGPVWLVAYRALRENWGDLSTLESQLGSFQINIGTAGGTEPLELLDILVAAEALGPYVRGETDEHPLLPPDASAGFAERWPEWIAMAEQLRTNPGDLSIDDEASLPVAAELLLAAGRTDDLAELIARAPGTSSVLHVATDIAIRLDRMCESYLAHPGEALQYGQLIYKFDR